MGLLDWLSEGIGSAMGGASPGASAPMVNATNNYQSPGSSPLGPEEMSPQMVPQQPPMMAPPAAPPPPAPSPGPLPQGGDPMADTGSGNNGGLPAAPFPQPRPVEAAGPAALPPNAAPTGGSGMPPAPPMDMAGVVNSYRKAGGNFQPPDEARGGGQSQAQTMIGRALGLDGNRESQIRGALGAGLKSVGENANKPGLAAFAGSMGSGIEGGKKADDTTTTQQDKYLQRAIQAKREGNQEKYQTNYLKYQIEATKAKLEATKEKAAGANSVMNSPEQLYLRAIGATNQDGGLKILANKVREAQKMGPDSKEAKAAQAEYDAAFAKVRDTHLGTLGVDPSKIKGLESKPGFSDKNPVKDFPKDPAAAQKAFDALPDGAYFINPKDGRLLTKKAAGGGQAPNPAQPQQQSGMMPPAPPMPMDPNDPVNQEAA